MPRVNCVRETPVVRSVRVKQLEGLFDVPPSEKSRLEWSVDLPIEAHPWSIGLIVGPSGCGKTTIAKELFGRELIHGFDWPSDRSILDGFPDHMGIKDVTGLLSSVGFSSPPAWTRPFGVLSNGEQFRVTVARAMAEQPELAVIDEFTSVVDRTVAKVGSAAVSKAVRSSERKLIAVACHYDIIEWLDPDWVYDPSSGSFQWRLERRRPEVSVRIFRGHYSAWKTFRGHHYLSSDLNKAARCYLGYLTIDGVERLASFFAVLPQPGSGNRYAHAIKRKLWRGHRSVVLPDFQGLGIGNAVVEAVAEEMWRSEGITFIATTASPAIIAHRRKRPWMWKETRKPGMKSASGKTGRLTTSFVRMTTGWEYIPEEKRK